MEQMEHLLCALEAQGVIKCLNSDGGVWDEALPLFNRLLNSEA